MADGDTDSEGEVSHVGSNDSPHDLDPDPHLLLPFQEAEYAAHCHLNMEEVSMPVGGWNLDEDAFLAYQISAASFFSSQGDGYSVAGDLIMQKILQSYTPLQGDECSIYGNFIEESKLKKDYMESGATSPEESLASNIVTGSNSPPLPSQGIQYSLDGHLMKNSDTQKGFVTDRASNPEEALRDRIHENSLKLHDSLHGLQNPTDFPYDCLRTENKRQKVELPIGVLEEPDRPVSLISGESLPFKDPREMRLSQKIPPERKLIAPETGQNAEKPKNVVASPATLLRIGCWEGASQYGVNVVAKLFFTQKKLVWEIPGHRVNRKIEIQWSDIQAINMTFGDKQSTILEVELNYPPKFFHETNLDPRKHIIWKCTVDFTAPQGPGCRIHHLEFSQGNFQLLYERLVSTDELLRILNPISFPACPLMYFESEYEKLDVAHRSNYSHIHGQPPKNLGPPQITQYVKPVVGPINFSPINGQPPKSFDPPQIPQYANLDVGPMNYSPMYGHLPKNFGPPEIPHYVNLDVGPMNYSPISSQPPKNFGPPQIPQYVNLDVRPMNHSAMYGQPPKNFGPPQIPQYDKPDAGPVDYSPLYSQPSKSFDPPQIPQYVKQDVGPMSVRSPIGGHMSAPSPDSVNSLAVVGGSADEERWKNKNIIVIEEDSD